MADSKQFKDMALTVHIGTGKTGSSSIQKTLATHKEALKQAGLAYIGLMGEELAERHYGWQKAGGWPQLAGLGAERAQHQIFDLLHKGIAAAQAAGLQRVIWSNESIFGNDGIVLPALRKLQEQGVAVSIVVYLRRHDGWARSAYYQWGVKHKTYKGPIKSFAEWYEDHKPHFFSGLKPWLAGDWRDLSIRNFDTSGDVAVDFLKYCELDPAEFQPTHDNETPNAVALALWALYNTQFHENVLPAELQRLLRQSGVLQRKTLPCDWNALLPTAEDVNAVAVDAAADRALLNELLAKQGQAPVQTSELDHKDMSVSQSQINAALLLALKSQSDRIESLKHRLAALQEKSA